MSDDTRQLILGALLGAIAGGAATLLAWKIFSKKLDTQFGQAGARMLTQGETQLRASLNQELTTRIPPMVRTEMSRTLATYNITPETGRRLNEALRLAERVGLI